MFEGGGGSGNGASVDAAGLALASFQSDRVVLRGRPPVWRHLLAVVCTAAVFVVGCAARAPVVTAPNFPDFPFPTVPEQLAESPEAGAHERAWALLQGGELVAASTAFQAVLAATPQFHPADAGLGYVRLAAGAADEAVASFDRALARSGAYIPALLGRGEALLAVGRTEEAIQSFEAVLAADPEWADLRPRVAELRFGSLMAQVGEARAAAENGQDAEARAAYERVIAASPDSGFLYIELADIERRAGDRASALSRLELAVSLDSTAVGAWLLMADILLEEGALDQAESALLRADAVEPGPEVDRRLAMVEERRRLELLPVEFRAIVDAVQLSRGELAALIGERFGAELEAAGTGPTAIITDARNHWAYGWVLSVVQAQVMEADTNYRFLPAEPVSRAVLADVIMRLLSLAEPASDTVPPRASFSDLAPDHLSYPAAAGAVAAGVLEPLARNSFQPARIVSGAEAIQALSRLAAMLD